MKKPLKRYDATFKRDAVELLLTSGKPLKVLAVELGVCDVTLRNWRDRHLQETEPIETDGKNSVPNNWLRSCAAPKRSSKSPTGGTRS